MPSRLPLYVRKHVKVPSRMLYIQENMIKYHLTYPFCEKKKVRWSALKASPLAAPTYEKIQKNKLYI